jgi:beta-galactosidase
MLQSNAVFIIAMTSAFFRHAKAAWLILLLCVFPALAAWSRETLPLNEWRFALSEATNTPAASGFDDSAWERVTLPHTWNAFDGELGDKHYFSGTGWYRTQFKLPPEATHQRVLLEFDGASLLAEVFVNGKRLGEHIGGFARFRFDATDAVNFSGDNLVAVRVNNASTDFIPRNGDFTIFGGLYRPARVLLTSAAHIATLDHASPGVFLTATNVPTAGAEVDARIELANDAAKKFSGTVRVTVKSPDGEKIISKSARIKIAAEGATETNLSFSIPQPHLWNGVADPFVYQTTIELVEADGKTVDSVVQPLGLRSFEVKPDAGFFLNGQHVQLHGVNRHQDWPDKGWAIGTNEMKEDLGIMQELGVNAVRLCHYQHDPFFYELCDQAGIAVWAELCFVNNPPLTPAGRDNAREQLRELIRQNYNHPSIFLWSLGNETWDAPGSRAAEDLLKDLAAVTREEDPSRVSTYASHHGLSDPRNFISDVIAFNKYFGWYGGNFPEFGKFLDDFHAANPQVRVGVGEYGAGASIYQHEENPKRPATGGVWHPEEWQAKYHEECWLQIKQRPWLWGSFVWCLFDFASAGRAEGDTVGRNDKGLVTADRQTRKDAFYWYQANWTTNAMVHITSKRFCDRTQAETGLKIYSNCEEVEAKLNGVALGKKSSTDCRFEWPQVELKPGVNRIVAIAYRAGQPVATDTCAWNLRAETNSASEEP